MNKNKVHENNDKQRVSRDMKRFTVHMDNDIFMKVRLHAIETGRYAYAVVNQALIEYFDRLEKK